MDLHLDDRLLHGRILHGWLPVLRPARVVLLARGLAGTPAAALYAAAAAELALPLVCGEVEAAPPPAPGDFWLTNAPATAAQLAAAGIAPARLVIIGLREAGGRPLAPDFTPSAESLAALAQLAAQGIPAVVQRFPGEAAVAVAALAEPAGRG